VGGESSKGWPGVSTTEWVAFKHVAAVRY
jgi:hypothetical protein